MHKQPYLIGEEQHEPDIHDQSRNGGSTRNRYLTLAVIFLVACLVILLRTAQLQFNSGAAAGIVETSGQGRMMIVEAPRGEILDSKGIPLAYSETTQTLQIASAGLSTSALNRMLLDLTNLLDAHQIQVKNTLTDYFDLTQASKESGAQNDLDFAFKKPTSEIINWQTKKDLFNLLDPRNESGTRYSARFARTNPDEFFDYLLYDAFQIEDRSAGGSRRYTDLEAFHIMQMRYLILEDNWLFQSGTPITLADDVSQTVIDIVTEQNYRYAGVVIGEQSHRRYTPESLYLSQVIGYIGKIDANEYDELKTFGYDVDDYVGKSGVEMSAERYLKGTDGLKPYAVWDPQGYNTETVGQSSGRDVRPGNTIELTIDLDLQKVGLQALLDTMEYMSSESLNSTPETNPSSASVVALDVKTGAVRVMANTPGYDIRDFLLQENDPEAAKRVQDYLTDTDRKPMQNRTIMENYAPGSTFKPFSATAALESGAITPNDTVFECHGHETIAEWEWTCLQEPINGHGPLDLVEGLVTSCNIYFYKMGVETGIDEISAWSKKFGLGEYTGIDLPGEVRGVRPSREMKRKMRLKPEDQMWFPADTCQTAIGQFDNSYTILQLARATAALATGCSVRPHVIQSVIAPNGVIVREEQIECVPLGMHDTTIDLIRQGMVRLTRESKGQVGVNFANYPYPVAAKTGTAEVGAEGNIKTNAVFICYAPADDPEIAIACLVEHGTIGDEASGIAKAILDAYFGLNEPDEDNDDVAESSMQDAIEFDMIDDADSLITDWQEEP